MTRTAFLAALEQLLAPLPEAERKDALSYYEDYLDAADRRGLLPMFYLELVTGLRKGEITALLWSDLDARNNTISVSKQSVKNPNGGLNSVDVKTVSSNPSRCALSRS